MVIGCDGESMEMGMNIVKTEKVNISSPKILSIIIPVYNIEEYIRECIESIMNQVASNDVEIICVDDGSSDSSLQILEDLKNTYICLKVFSKENEGVSATRNYGVKRAAGEYVWFIDGDDYLKQGCLPAIIEQLKSSMERSLYVVESVGTIEADYYKKYHLENTHLKFKKNRYLAPPGPVNLIVPRESVLDNKFETDLAYGEDYFWTFLLGNRYKQAIYVSPAVYCYRQRNNSAMNSRDTKTAIKKIDSFLRLYDKYARLQNLDTLQMRLKRELKRRKKECVQAVLLTLTKEDISETEARRHIEQLRIKNRYPYLPIWENLFPKRNLKQYKVNLISFFYFIEPFFWFVYRRVKEIEK